MAGKIGTSDRMTVTVFGPVVNLASRLETMTKQLRVPILLDEPTADIVRRRLSSNEGRLRKLARVQPYGMETPLTVSELLLPMNESEELTDAHLELYEQGVDHFLAGRWQESATAWGSLGERYEQAVETALSARGRARTAALEDLAELGATATLARLSA